MQLHEKEATIRKKGGTNIQEELEHRRKNPCLGTTAFSNNQPLNSTSTFGYPQQSHYGCLRAVRNIVMANYDSLDIG